MTLLLLLLFCDATLFATTCLGADCDESYECVLQSDITESTTDLYCRGDNSCRQVTTIQSTSTADLYCTAAFSCYKITNLKTIN